MKRISGMLLLFCLLYCCALAASAAPVLATSEAYVALPGGLPCLVPHQEGRLLESVAPGSSVFFPIEGAARAEDLEGLRIIVDDWISGEQWLGTPQISYLLVYDASGTESLGYRYLAELPVLTAASDPQDSFVNARAMINDRRAGGERIDFSFAVLAGGQSLRTESIRIDSASHLLEFTPQTTQVLLTFGSVARFEVDVRGQGAVGVGFSTRPITDVAITYPDAALRYVYWRDQPIFNHIGELVLYAGEGEILYEFTGSGLVRLQAPYSLDEGGYVLTTRRLGRYIFATGELGAPRALTARPNPPTGQ